MRRGQMLSFVTVLLLLIAGAGVGRAQQRPSSGVPQQGRSTPPSVGSFPIGGEQEEPGASSMRDSQARARNNERQKRLVSDTDKLLALVTQLHADVAKTDRNILSLDVVRRSEEIEKLAHSIKERMKS